MMTHAAREPEQIGWAFVLAGFTSQLAAAYCDAARGPSLPAMAAALHLEFTQSGWFFAAAHGAAAVATVLMIVALNRWSERILLMVIGVIGVLAAVMAQLVTGFWSLLPLGAMLGVSVTAMGTMANILVVEGTPNRLQSRMLPALHSSYGIGSMAATSLVGLALVRGWAWGDVYLVNIPLYGGLVIFAWLRLPGAPPGSPPRTVQSPRLTPLQGLVVLIFSVYVAAEVATTMWLTSYLVDTAGFTLARAAPLLTVFFLAMTVTRVACALLMRQSIEIAILSLSLLVPLAAFAAGYGGGWHWCFAIMGGCGPFFPVFLARASRNFPTKWRSVTIWAMMTMNISVSIVDVVVGRLADSHGLRIAFLVPPVLFATALALFLIYCIYEPRPSAGPAGR